MHVAPPLDASCLNAFVAKNHRAIARRTVRRSRKKWHVVHGRCTCMHARNTPGFGNPVAGKGAQKTKTQANRAGGKKRGTYPPRSAAAQKLPLPRPRPRQGEFGVPVPFPVRLLSLGVDVAGSPPGEAPPAPALPRGEEPLPTPAFATVGKGPLPEALSLTAPRLTVP